MAKRPKTVGLMQTVSRRTGIWLRFRLRQITPSHRRHIPVRRERRIKGDGFLRASDRKVPRRQMQDFERRVRGELQRRNRNFFQTEGAADFRERVSRSIWPSKPGLSGYRILPVKGILSFTEEVSLALCVSPGWGRVFFGRESSLLVTFLNAAFVGGPSGLRKPENSEAPFRNFLSARGYGWLRRLRNEAWKK